MSRLSPPKRTSQSVLVILPTPAIRAASVLQKTLKKDLD